MYTKMLEFLTSDEAELPAMDNSSGDSTRTKKASADMHKKEADVERNRQRDYADGMNMIKKGLSSASLDSNTKRQYRDRLRSLSDKIKASKQKQRAAQSLSSIR